MGGLSVVGVIVLIGLAIADDNEPDALTVPPAPTILAPLDETTSSVPGSAPSSPPDSSPTTDGVASSIATVPDTAPGSTPATEPAEPASETTTAETVAPTDPPPPTTTPILDVEQRQGVRAQVINGGGAAGAATFVTGVLEGEGFVRIGPDDAATLVEQTVVLYAPGQEVAGATVGQVLEVPADRVVEAPPDDPNWAAFASELDVLVVLGPE